jgi:hypothetical protein
MGIIWELLIYFGNARVIAVLRWLAILGLAGWLIEPANARHTSTISEASAISRAASSSS